jgi:hypothetical protein
MKKLYALLIFCFVLRVPAAIAGTGPDLVVNQADLEHEWIVRDENLDGSLCSVVEGGVIPGMHMVLRFTVTTDNIGDADINIGDPRVHVANNDGLFEFATCHQHYHFRNYARYELIDPVSGKSWRAAKRGFCMIDSLPVPASTTGNPPRSKQFTVCGTLTEAGNQGITKDWGDTYKFFLGGQYFVLDGGDRQDPVPPGTYIIRITVNPPFVPDAQNPCRNLDSATGFCHALFESNYSNNVTEVTVTIPDHPGKSGSGPGVGLPQPKGEPIDN